jgi:hypothetical protein
MLQQGRTVADVLYLAPEGAPHIFLSPKSATDGPEVDDNFRNETSLPDRKGYNFDGCPPSMLYKATVKDGSIVFPGGASYRLLALPAFETMTPELLKKIKELVNDGATVIGVSPKKSPGLVNYPLCDQEIQTLAKELWGDDNTTIPETLTTRTVGKGKIIYGKELLTQADRLYPQYALTAGLLASMQIPEDFHSDGAVRYTHRTLKDMDIYFVANKTENVVNTEGVFRITGRQPELWDPMTGTMRPLPEYTVKDKQIAVPLQFEPFQSYFVVFRKQNLPAVQEKKNFPEYRKIAKLDKPWEVSFDPQWGGPEKVVFDPLIEWTQHADPGIKYYSGTAVYKQRFDLPPTESNRLYIDLGKVKNMARVSLNGKEVGVIWTAPWRIEVTEALKPGRNELTVEVVNLWANRLIGDEQLPDDGIQNGQWPEWLLNGTKRPGNRYTFATYKHYRKDSPLLESGLIGPVSLGEIHCK